MNSARTVELIFKLVDGKKQYSQIELNNFIEMSFNIALFLVSRRQKKLLSLMKRDAISFEDIAIESIAVLFSRENDGFPVLKNSFKKWVPKIQTTQDAAFFINQILAKLVDQQINILLKESNPVFSKILSRINYLAKRSDLSKDYFMGICYLTESGTLLRPPFIPAEEFERIILEYPLDEKKMLKNVFDMLREEGIYTPAIPLNMLIYKLINIHSVGITGENLSPPLDENIDTEELIKTELRFVKRKINRTYLKTGKLSKEEVHIFMKTIEDIAFDMQCGGTQSTLFNYFNEHTEGLTLDVYQTKYHNILEYLLRLFRARIVKRITA